MNLILTLSSYMRQKTDGKEIRMIDLFCGIGGFRYASENLGVRCVFSSDIDEHCRDAYAHNFGERPAGDITKIDPQSIPDHDLLVGGFPCQPFSIIGERRGFTDTRGTLFFNVARILEEKTPAAFMLENVKQLNGHNGGKTIKRIMSVLDELGYWADKQVLNALNFGLPQKRERVIIVGIRKDLYPELKFNWKFPEVEMQPLSKLLEKNIDKKYFASKEIVLKRAAKHQSRISPAIWHENKSGNVTSYPYSCTVRAGASYNYLLVDGVRRLTPREMLRLQGFPERFQIMHKDHRIRHQVGNAVPVPMIRAVMERLLMMVRPALQNNQSFILEKNRLKKILTPA